MSQRRHQRDAHAGAQPPAPTWGGLLAADLGYLSYQWYAPLVPAVLIMATVWACNLLADAIRDVSGEAGRTAWGAQAHPQPPLPAPRAGGATR